MSRVNHPVRHLYVHVPFCAAKCEYCAFYSEPGRESQMDDYVDAVVRELDALTGPAPAPATRPVALRPTTIFFGGGTPSLLPVTTMRRLLESLRARVPLDDLQEWTIECNPATVSAEKARLYREFGVNRLSLGVQAFDDAVLKTLGRIHSARQAVQSYAALRRAGFDNLNLDLMFALPGQSLEQFRAALDQAVALEPEHLSVYCLTFEEDTKFWSLFTNGRLAPDADVERAMFELAVDRLRQAGYRHYEISNFAKPGRECAHNRAYWEGRDYLGLGPSACSTVGTRRWQNVADLDRYLAAFRGRNVPADDLESGSGVPPLRSRDASRKQAATTWPRCHGHVAHAGRRCHFGPTGATGEEDGGKSANPAPENTAIVSAVDFEEAVPRALRDAERAAFGMRMLEGVPASLVRDRWPREIAGLLSDGLVEWRGDRLQLTRRGLLFADAVAAEFV